MLAEILGSSRIILQYILSSFKKKPRLIVVGVLTVLIVVFFIGILENAVKFSSIIFWNIAEDQSSQTDFVC
jgi:hypothetical protein